MIKKRIVQLLEYKGVLKEIFFKEMGMTSANFRGDAQKRPINSNAIENIFTLIPDLNLEWLITGKGSMLKEAVQPVAAVPNAELAQLAAQIEALKNEIIELQRELINAQKENTKLIKDQAAIKSRQHPAAGVAAGKLKT